MKMFVDIETRKVEVAPPYQPGERPNQRPVTRRWQAFMVGYVLCRHLSDAPYRGEPTLIADDEEALLAKLDAVIIENGVTEVVYSATRRFDEMILRGRFINARREHLIKPGPWPRLRCEVPTWTCLKPLPNPDPEGSRMAPVWWDSGDAALMERVKQHCLDDVRRLARR